MTDRKVAIITGASAGIGRAAAVKFAREGYVTAIIARHNIKAAGDEIRALGAECGIACGECFDFTGDVSVEADVKAMVEEVDRRYGRVDVLNCNAGVVVVKPIEETAYDEFINVYKINVGGMFLFTKYVLPIMKRRRSGAIVNLGSVSGHVGQTQHAVYGATKAGCISFTRAIAWEVKDFGIRVNSVSPGSVDTPMLRGDCEGEARRLGVSFEAVKKEREAEQAFNRWGAPEEVAEAIYFMASEKASFITGADLRVDCGWVAK
jgi:NAD(P)-dependent dehydrogenase (short-subunit alcohol dehydrogenase family)